MTDFLNGHDYLYGIETVQAQVVVEVRFLVQLYYDELVVVGSLMRGIIPWLCR